MGSYVADFDFPGIRVETEVDAAASAEAGVPFKYLRRAEPCHSPGPSLSFPRFLAGIQSKQSFSRVQSGSHVTSAR